MDTTIVDTTMHQCTCW